MSEWELIDESLITGKDISGKNKGTLGFAKKSWNRRYGIGIQLYGDKFSVGVYKAEASQNQIPQLWETLNDKVRLGIHEPWWEWYSKLEQKEALLKMYDGEAEICNDLKRISEEAKHFIAQHV